MSSSLLSSLQPITLLPDWIIYLFPHRLFHLSVLKIGLLPLSALHLFILCELTPPLSLCSFYFTSPKFLYSALLLFPLLCRLASLLILCSPYTLANLPESTHSRLYAFSLEVPSRMVFDHFPLPLRPMYLKLSANRSASSLWICSATSVTYSCGLPLRECWPLNEDSPWTSTLWS